MKLERDDNNVKKDSLSEYKNTIFGPRILYPPPKKKEPPRHPGTQS